MKFDLQIQNSYSPRIYKLAEKYLGSEAKLRCRSDFLLCFILLSVFLKWRAKVRIKPERENAEKNVRPARGDDFFRSQS